MRKRDTGEAGLMVGETGKQGREERSDGKEAGQRKREWVRWEATLDGLGSAWQTNGARTAARAAMGERERPVRRNLSLRLDGRKTAGVCRNRVEGRKKPTSTVVGSISQVHEKKREKLGMAISTETLCGQAFGAGQYHMMGIYMQRSWIVLMVTAILLLPFYIFAAPIFRLLGQTDELSEAAGKIALWFIPIIFTFVFSCTMQMFLQSQLKNLIIGWLAGISFFLHLVLSWIMVDKLDWGVPGAMGSLVLASWFSVIGQLIYVFGGWCPETWKGFSRAAFSELWPVVKLSISSGLMMCLELWYNSVLLLFAGFMKNATISVAAFSICLNITAWVLMLSLGFLTAASVRVSNELGRGNAEAAKFAIKVVFGTSLSIGTVFFIIFLSLGKVISYAFTSSIEVAEVVSGLSFLLALTILLNSIQPIFNGVAVGAGWQSTVAYVNIGCYYVIGIPFGLLLAYVAHLQVKGIWIGMTVGVAAQTLVLIYLTWKTDWDLQIRKVTSHLDGWFLPETNDNSSGA